MNTLPTSSVKSNSALDTAEDLPSIISLFSGAGGLDLGFQKQGFTISLAIDLAEAAILTHKKNFPNTPSFAADLIALGPEGVFSLVEKHIPLGSKIALIGGPPCQGFSRANTSSHQDDPRNGLPKLYLEIVQRLQKNYIVEFVVFENVMGMKDKKHNPTYQKLIKELGELDFDITEKELCALDFGVPQTRRRIILSALKKGAHSSVLPQHQEGPTTVRCVLEGLPPPLFFDRSLKPDDIPFHENHWTMRPKSKKFLSPENLGHESRSFKKLRWDQPSPTVAYGNREIHVHPIGTRRLSVYEAMLLQGFPKEFVIKGTFSEQVLQVSNAVPPPLSECIAKAVKVAMEKTKNGH